LKGLNKISNPNSVYSYDGVSKQIVKGGRDFLTSIKIFLLFLERHWFWTSLYLIIAKFQAGGNTSASSRWQSSKVNFSSNYLEVKSRLNMWINVQQWLNLHETFPWLMKTIKLTCLLSNAEVMRNCGPFSVECLNKTMKNCYHGLSESICAHNTSPFWWLRKNLTSIQVFHKTFSMLFYFQYYLHLWSGYDVIRCLGGRKGYWHWGKVWRKIYTCSLWHAQIGEKDGAHVLPFLQK
jgi:hypothetical protein